MLNFQHNGDRNFDRNYILRELVTRDYGHRCVWSWKSRAAQVLCNRQRIFVFIERSHEFTLLLFKAQNVKYAKLHTDIVIQSSIQVAGSICACNLACSTCACNLACSASEVQVTVSRQIADKIMNFQFIGSCIL